VSVSFFPGTEVFPVGDHQPEVADAGAIGPWEINLLDHPAAEGNQTGLVGSIAVPMPTLEPEFQYSGLPAAPGTIDSV